MGLPRFTFTDRAAPFIELGVGDTRTDVGVARWDVAHWDNATDATWSGSEPLWIDQTCHGYTIEVQAGRQRNVDTFAPATVTVVLDNQSGWADATLLTLQPGRPLRVGVDHVVSGRHILFRGIIDAVTPSYTPTAGDTVELSAVCALGEVGRVGLEDLGDPGVGGTETADIRVHRILNAARWPMPHRDVAVSGVACLPTRLGQQVADMFAVVSESTGGAVYGDTAGRVAFRGRDWQMFLPDDPPDATIGNGGGDVCPSEWQLSHRRDDMVTKVILAREGVEESHVYNDETGQTLYGVETWEALDLICSADVQLLTIATRQFRVRGGASSTQRVERVLLDAATGDAVVDVVAAVNVFDQPSRYRCRLNLSRGVVFDAEMLATGVRHVMTPDEWTCDIDLDAAAPFATAAGRWDSAAWNLATWADLTERQAA